MEITLREFTEQNWYGWAGAERFSDNSEPQIAEYGIHTILCDKHGVHVTTFNKHGQPAICQEVSMPEKQQALDIAKRICVFLETTGRTPHEFTNWLKSLGFINLNI